ncbi:hypothetical protein OROMI_006660 [Orobanche minor]
MLVSSSPFASDCRVSSRVFDFSLSDYCFFVLVVLDSGSFGLQLLYKHGKFSSSSLLHLCASRPACFHLSIASSSFDRLLLLPLHSLFPSSSRPWIDTSSFASFQFSALHHPVCWFHLLCSLQTAESRRGFLIFRFQIIASSFLSCLIQIFVGTLTFLLMMM